MLHHKTAFRSLPRICNHIDAPLKVNITFLANRGGEIRWGQVQKLEGLEGGTNFRERFCNTIKTYTLING